MTLWDDWNDINIVDIDVVVIIETENWTYHIIRLSGGALIIIIMTNLSTLPL